MGDDGEDRSAEESGEETIESGGRGIDVRKTEGGMEGKDGGRRGSRERGVIREDLAAVRQRLRFSVCVGETGAKREKKKKKKRVKKRNRDRRLLPGLPCLAPLPQPSPEVALFFFLFSLLYYVFPSLSLFSFFSPVSLWVFPVPVIIFLGFPLFPVE
jgi:hypothetical protein